MTPCDGCGDTEEVLHPAGDGRLLCRSCHEHADACPSGRAPRHGAEPSEDGSHCIICGERL